MQDHASRAVDQDQDAVEFARTSTWWTRLAVSLQGDGKGNDELRTLIDSGAAIADGDGPDESTLGGCTRPSS